MKSATISMSYEDFENELKEAEARGHNRCARNFEQIVMQIVAEIDSPNGEFDDLGYSEFESSNDSRIVCRQAYRIFEFLAHRLGDEYTKGYDQKKADERMKGEKIYE